MGSQCNFSRRGVDRVVVTECQENESCNKVSNFLEMLDDRIRYTHKETVAVVKPWEDIGSNKSLGCVFSENPADWTNASKLEISSLADFYDVLLRGQFWVKNESKVPGRIREGDVVRAKSNRVREGNCMQKVSRKTKREREVLLFCRRSVWADFPSSMFLCRLCMHWVLWWGWSLHWEERISVYRVVSYDIGERRSVQDEENGPILSPEAHRTWAVMVTNVSYWLRWTDICLRGMTETIGVQ